MLQKRMKKRILCTQERVYGLIVNRIQSEIETKLAHGLRQKAEIKSNQHGIRKVNIVNKTIVAEID